MNQNENSEEALFKEALLKPSDTERAAFLEGACRNNPALRARLDLFLEGHFKAKGFLDTLPESGRAELLLTSVQLFLGRQSKAPTFSGLFRGGGCYRHGGRHGKMC